MAQLQDNVKIQYNGFILAVQDGIFKIKQWFNGLPKWERVTFTVMLILLVPGLLTVRYGGEFYFTKSYNRLAIVAHPAVNSPDPLSVTPARVVQNPNGSTTAYAQVTNPNLDLSLSNLNYTFHFFNSRNEEVSSQNGSTYLLANSKKWIVISKVQSLQPITSATFKVTDEKLNWQKRIDLPQVTLKMSEPYVYEQVNPLSTLAEGAVVNNSPYDLNQVSLLLVLYGKDDKVLAVTTREENSVKAFERRAYKLEWPGIYHADVSRIELQAYTNTLDPQNISAGSQ